MSWRENLRPASFRGISFWVESHQKSGGRRTVTHQFPGRDTPYTEDLGRDAKKFSIVAYVAVTRETKDYMSQRDALIEALNAYGAGELVHPYFGTLNVHCEAGFTVSESKEIGGVATFNIPFVEAGETTSPVARRSPTSNTNNLHNQGILATRKTFRNSFNLLGQSDYLQDSALENLLGIANLYSLISRNFMMSDIFEILETIDLILNFKSSVLSSENILSNVSSLPATFANRFEREHRHLKNIDGSYRMNHRQQTYPLPVEVIKGLEKAYGYEHKLPLKRSLTPLRRQEIKNNKAINALVRQTALIEASRLIPFVNWSTIQEAELARNALLDNLDLELGSVLDDELFNALTELRLLVATSVPPENASIPRQTKFTPKLTIPALTLSYMLYDNIDKSQELGKLNRIRHPGFIAGGKELEILTYAR